MRSILKKGLIYLWIISILINACPIVVFASFFTKEDTSILEMQTDLKSDTTDDVEIEASVVGEIKELRTLNEKHYLLDDGSMKAVIYPYDVHYEESGELIDIDNTLIETTSSFKTKNNKIGSEFSKDENLLNLTYKGHQISWKMKDVNKTKSEVKENLLSKMKIISLPSLESKIKYSNVFQDIDLEYELVSNMVEENIVIQNKESLKNEFVYFLKTDDLTVKELSKNELTFIDKENKEIFYVSAPVMYDSDLEFSSDITLIPKKVKGGYEITLQADNNWLTSEERVYPITIDPVIATSPNRDDIIDTYIYPNDASNTGKGNAHILRVGSTSYSDINTNKNPFRSLIKFSLPTTLTSGDQIIKAELHIFNYQKTDSWVPPSGDVQIDIHAVTKDWNESNAYWNNMKDSYNKSIVDYIKYGYDSNSPNKENKADITSLVKEWYVSGNNYGLMLKEHVEKKVIGRNDISFISSDTSSAYTYSRPYIIIQYRNQTGLESYLTTHTQDIGRTTVYTNDYNGNLTLIHNDVSTPGNRLPVRINHVYNTNDKELDIGYGKGFRLNLNQTLEEQPISGIKYLKYIDEDATRHYFYEESGMWKDEDGLDLTITASGTNYIMKDKGGNTSTFVKNGSKWYLKEITDTNNNKIIINYSSSNYNLITSVKDAAGDTLTLTYTDNLLTSIKDTDSRVYNYGYTSKNLTSITYPDTLKSTYQYTSTNLLSKVTNVDGKSVDYSYYAKKPYRVKTITEYGSNGTKGNSLSILYGANTTNFKDSKEHIEAYTFNNLGQTLSINSIDTNHTLKTAYGSSYQYGTSGSNKNKLLLETSMSKTTQNLLLNSGAENNLANWTKTGTVVIEKSPYFGTNSFKLTGISTLIQSVPLEKNKTYTLSAYVKGDSNACFYLPFTDKKCAEIENTNEWDRYSITFQMPDTISGNVSIGISNETEGNIYVDNIQLEEGDSLNPYNIIDNGNFNYDLSGWTKNANVTVNDKVVSAGGVKAMNFKGEMNQYKQIYQHTYTNGKKGDTYHLNYWVKNEGAPLTSPKKARILIEFLNDSNVLQSLEVHASPDSTNWQYVSGEIVAKQDYNRVKIMVTYNYNVSNIYYTNIGFYKDDVSNSYTYDTNGNVISTKDLANQNSTYKYSKKNELISATNPKGRNFYYEYDYNYTNRLLTAFNQNGLTSNYQYDSYGNIINNKIEEPSMIRSIEEIDENTYYYFKPIVSNLKIGKNSQGIRLLDTDQKWKFKKTGDNYSILDEDNKAITVKENSAANSVALLLENYTNNVKQRYKIINNNDGTFTFQTEVSGYKNCIDIAEDKYNSNQKVQQYKCNNSVIQKFMIIPVEHHSKYIETNAQYTENGNYQTKTIDQKGKETTTTYNESRGTVSSVVDANNNITEYTYDIMDNITLIQSGNITNTYTYDKDYLKKITHNNFDYDFIYDEYGNTTSIKVAGKPLINHQYEANNGYLLKSTYGNKDTINYQYDAFGRISKKINTTGEATYFYNNSGSLSHLKYLNNDIYYTYDLSGRITDIKENSFQKQYQYDKYNNLDKVKYKYKTNSKEVSYTYDLDNKLETIIYSNYSIKYTYDKLDRLIKKEIIKGDKTYTTTYEYYNIDEYKTTTLLKSITNGDTKLSYIYDNNGNIKTISKNDSIQKRYVYDSNNQLIREHDGKRYGHIGYKYDDGGNRTQKYSTYYMRDLITTYPSIVPTDWQVDKLTPDSTSILGEYQYDANWKDQLTKVNDNLVTYDSIGNMTSYNGYNYTWTNGNELKSITQDNNKYEYEYNIDGIRTKKVVNGKTTSYYLEGSNIIYEDRNGQVLEYFYDESGVSGLKVNNKEYYFVKNIQGDIIEILDEEFNVVAEYTYDAWGIVTVKNLTEDSIGDINPYRYRGYYYDAETNLYYLNSRYYNPALGRFISADSIESLLENFENSSQYNLYSYCFNNSINMVDDLGQWPKWLKNAVKIGIGIVAIGFGVAIGGAPLVPTITLALKISTASAIVNAGYNAVGHRISTGSWKGSDRAALNGAIDGAANGFMMGGLTAGALAYNGITVIELGRLKPENKSGNGYYGVKYQIKKESGNFATRSIELHPPHNGGAHQYWHFQQNKWYSNKVNGPLNYVSPNKHWPKCWGKLK